MEQSGRCSFSKKTKLGIGGSLVVVLAFAIVLVVVLTRSEVDETKKTIATNLTKWAGNWSMAFTNGVHVTYTVKPDGEISFYGGKTVLEPSDDQVNFPSSEGWMKGNKLWRDEAWSYYRVTQDGTLEVEHFHLDGSTKKFHNLDHYCCSGIGHHRENIYLLGGTKSGQYLDSVEVFNPDRSEWTHRTSMHTPREMMAVTVLDNELYVIGGANSKESVNTVEKWSPETQRWSSETKLNTGRKSHGAAVLNGEIFLLGGFNDGGRLNQVDKYVNNKWQKVSSMPNGLGGVTNAVELRGNLYVFADCEGACKTVVMFDGVSWRNFADMNQARFSSGVASLDGKIYVAGGDSGNGTALNTVEEYDPAVKKWNFVARMRVKRIGPALVSQGGKLYVFGGANNDEGFGGLTSVEMYDPFTGKWTDVGNMKLCSGFIGAAVLRHCPFNVCRNL